jgi:multiple sugar transport system permease protein
MSTTSAIREKNGVHQAQERPRRRGLSRKHREWVAGYLFLAPDLLGLLVFLAAPMIIALGLGFFEVDGFGNFSFVGLNNYQLMFADQQFLTSLRVTLTYVFLVVPGIFIAGLLLALLVKQKIPFVGILRSMFFIPNVVSLVVVGFVWKFLLADNIGLLSQLAQSLGLGVISWLGDPRFALSTVLCVVIWFSMGYNMIIFLAGLQEIPREYYEAANIDGAGAWTTFWNITWPLLRPTSFFVLLTLLVTSVSGQSGFDLIYVMTKGGPANSTSLGIFYIYEQAFLFGRYGYAAAMASFLVAVMLVATIILFAVTKGGRFDFD